MKSVILKKIYIMTSYFLKKSMKYILFLIVCFFSFTWSVNAVIQDVATQKGSVMIQDWGIDWGYSKKLVWRTSWSGSFSTYTIEIKDINWNILFQYSVRTGRTNGFWDPVLINMNNGKYLFNFISKASDGSRDYIIIDTIAQTIEWYGSTWPNNRKSFLKADSAENIYIVLYAEYWSTNGRYLYYDPLSWIRWSCTTSNAGNCTLSNWESADFQSHWDDFLIWDYYELNYINWAYFYTDIIWQTSVLQVSSITGNSVENIDITQQSGFVSEHTQFFVDSIDIANWTVKMVISLIDENTYLAEYNLPERTLALLDQIEDEFIIWYFNWEFQSIPKWSPLLDNADVTKSEAFLWFIEINGNMLVTAYDTTRGAWIIDDEFTPITYGADELFSNSESWWSAWCSWTWCTQPWNANTWYDSSIWDFDKDWDWDVSIWEFFSGIVWIPWYFLGKLMDFFANIKSLIEVIIDSFTLEEKTFSFIPSTYAAEQDISNIFNDNYNEEEYNDTFLWKINSFIDWFIFFLVFLFALLSFIYLIQWWKND